MSSISFFVVVWVVCIFMLVLFFVPIVPGPVFHAVKRRIDDGRPLAGFGVLALYQLAASLGLLTIVVVAAMWAH